MSGSGWVMVSFSWLSTVKSFEIFTRNNPRCAVLCAPFTYQCERTHTHTHSHSTHHLWQESWGIWGTGTRCPRVERTGTSLLRPRPSLGSDATLWTAWRLPQTPSTANLCPWTTCHCHRPPAMYHAGRIHTVIHDFNDGNNGQGLKNVTVIPQQET